MKRLLFLLLLTTPLYAQYEQRMPAAWRYSARPITGNFIGRYISVGDTVMVYTEAGWQVLYITTTYHKDSVGTGGPGSPPDSTVFVTKTNLDSVKANRPYASHAHAQANVTGLPDSLANHQTQFSTAINSKAASSHTQAISTVTGQADTNAAHLPRTEATTLLGTKVNYSDTTSTVANQWRLNAKQNLIANLADTSKYVETDGPASVPTAGTSGYVLKKNSATNYDYSWAADLSGGTWTELKRTAADTTFAAINQGMKVIGGLAFNMVANGVYEIDGNVTFGNVAATTTGLVLGFTGPASSVAAITCQIPLAVDGVGGEWQGWLNGAADSTISTATPVTSSWFTAYVFGRIYNGANAGAFQLKWRPEAAANMTVRQYSALNYRKVSP